VSVRSGYGISTAHHGELFQGEIEDATGTHRRCLVSLPCPALWATATFLPQRHAPLVVEPAVKQKTYDAATLALARCGATGTGGLLVVTNNIVEGKGYGSSTADCVAAVLAVGDALGCRLTPNTVARIVVEAETASDNVMFPHAVLFAHRDGLVVEDFRRQVPVLEVIGIDTARDVCVNTLTYPPAPYSASDLAAFAGLVAAMRQAIRSCDARLMAHVATACACINERFLPKRFFDELQAIAAESGALGLAVAHSGTVSSFLLDPADPLLEQRVAAIRTRLLRLQIDDVLRFNTRTVAAPAALDPEGPAQGAVPLPG
jgi:uncharacterized protein involved in propanediol utilization